MRLGEIKKELDRVIDANYKIQIHGEALYGGQAQRVNNYADIIRVLEILKDQEWNEQDYTNIKSIIQTHGVESESEVLGSGEFNNLTAYVGALNTYVSIYYHIISSSVEEDDKYQINIKLPDTVDSLKDLSSTNSSVEGLMKIYKFFGLCYTFKGIEKGSIFYAILVSGAIEAYPLILMSLHVSQEVFKTRREFFDSESARINFEMLKAKQDKYTFEDYKKEYEKQEIDQKVKDELSKVDEKTLNGRTHAEAHTNLVKAVTELVKQMDGGTEFHLSLNPPEYAKESQGRLEINYKKIKEQNAEQIDEKNPAQIESEESKDQIEDD